jgi:hypothetical protein
MSLELKPSLCIAGFSVSSRSRPPYSLPMLGLILQLVRSSETENGRWRSLAAVAAKGVLVQASILSRFPLFKQDLLKGPLQ